MESQDGRVELPQFGDECLLFGGCSASVWVCLGWQEAGQGSAGWLWASRSVGCREQLQVAQPPPPRKLSW